MKLTVATWNVDHWKRSPAQRAAAWQRLRDSGVDVALLQETVPPRDLARSEVVWREMGRHRRFGSAVVSLRGWPVEEITTARSRHGDVDFPLLETFPGSVAIARIHPPGAKPMTFISLYAVIDVYSTTTLLRQVADLMPLFDSAYGDNVILGGDLNISLQVGGDHDRNLERERNRASFAAIESLGLRDLFKSAREKPRPIGPTCACQQTDCYHVRTHKNASNPAGPVSHLDYLFATPALADRCGRLRLDDDLAAWALSDHCAVVAELDLEEHIPNPTAWDERFASDVEDTLLHILREPRTWGAWKPGTARPVVRHDRALESWIAAFWDGTLDDGRPAQLELGIWRQPSATGHALTAHAGLNAKPMGAKLAGLEVRLRADGSPHPARPEEGEGTERVSNGRGATGDLKIVSRPNADYVVVPLADGVLPDGEVRVVLDALIAGARLTV